MMFAITRHWVPSIVALKYLYCHKTDGDKRADLREQNLQK